MPEFGKRLAEDRGGKTLGQIVAHVHRLSLSLDGFTRGQLSRYEAGEVAAPDPVALLYLARIYRQDVRVYLDLLAHDREALAVTRTDSLDTATTDDLPGHGARDTTPPSKAGAHVTETRETGTSGNRQSRREATINEDARARIARRKRSDRKA